jgi:phosphoglycolate phosphatase
MPPLKGLIFDLDGTLIDSAPDLRHALNAMLKDYGRGELGLDTVTRMTGDGMMPLITRAFEATGGVPEGFNSYSSFQVFIAHYRNLNPDPAQIYPGGREAIERYFKAGVKLGICTNKQEAATVRLLEQLELARYFTFIAGGDTFPVHKPHPDHVRGVLLQLGSTPANSVMIGDGPNDVTAARGAGVACIVVMHGYGGDYAELRPDKAIGGFGELEEALKALGFSL